MKALVILIVAWVLSWGIALGGLLTHRPDPFVRPGVPAAAATEVARR